MTIDERVEALTMNLELMGHRLADMEKLISKDGENIRGLARIAEIHEHRIERLKAQ